MPAERQMNSLPKASFFKPRLGMPGGPEINALIFGVSFWKQ
jgi:hypothetical protein